MLLENLYRLLFDNQQVTLIDTREQKILWHGSVRNIPIEYLSWVVDCLKSCPINLNASEITIFLI